MGQNFQFIKQKADEARTRREETWRRLEENLKQQLSEKQNEIELSILSHKRRMMAFLALLFLAILVQIGIYILPTQAKDFPEPKSKLDSIIKEETKMNEDYLTMSSIFEEFAKEHDQRLNALENSLKELLKSASEQSDEELGLLRQLQNLQSNVAALLAEDEKTQNFLRKLTMHYNATREDHLKRISRLEKKLGIKE